jgi:hypothetical protein
MLTGGYCYQYNMTPKQIGQAVRKARGQRSIREVAGAAGLHRDQVTSIEQATKAYTMPAFLRLCKALGGWDQVFPAKGSEAAFTKGATGSDDVRG